ncbi:MAG: hypothetical protein HG447_009730 [Prevotella sp.]|jgi:hypothetical protein|nr:hypothetical protein [Prevotella sp.]
MKALVYSLLSLLLFVAFSCHKRNGNTHLPHAKTPAYVPFINNRTIKYNILLVACDTCAPIHDIGYRVRISLSAKEDSIIKHISKRQWLSMLNDKKTDFAANLLLYQLYEREAIMFLQIKDASDWRLAMKDDDLYYWRRTLK